MSLPPVTASSESSLTPVWIQFDGGSDKRDNSEKHSKVEYRDWYLYKYLVVYNEQKVGDKEEGKIYCNIQLT